MKPTHLRTPRTLDECCFIGSSAGERRFAVTAFAVLVAVLTAALFGLLIVFTR